MSELPNARFEWKFSAGDLSLPEMLGIVRRHPALFREAYPPRDVNNVYLDTAARQDYWDHLRGASSREKTRIRWYGPLSGIVPAPALERKIRRGLVGGKAAHRLPGLESAMGLAPAALRDTFARAGVPEALCARLRHAEPALVNRYHRHYFVSADGRFRLTVDGALCYYGIHPATGGITPQARRVDGLIVEVKFDPQHAEDAPFITNHLPLRATRCSKYVAGIECGLPAAIGVLPALS